MNTRKQALILLRRLKGPIKHTITIRNPFLLKPFTTMNQQGEETTEFVKGGRVLIYNEQEPEDSVHNRHVLDQCSNHLKQGHLVAFPTETVYGLGANALNTEAVLSIFKAKGRPLTDPVIVHVLDIESATRLIHVNDKILSLYRYLAKRFWPGPLTIVAKSNSKLIPACITANTGFVGIRCPEFDLARKLLAHSQLPVAAPSANKFGHVSPTRSHHVMDDLSDSEFPIFVLKSSAEDDFNRTCRVGIESTVVKLMESEFNENIINLYVLRRGGISVEQVTNCINEFQQSEDNCFNLSIQIQVVAKDHSVSNDTEQNQYSPGQMLTHYAPYVPAYLLHKSNTEQQTESGVPLSETVIIDFGAQLAHLASSALAYLDLSPSGDVNEARTIVFQALRTSEKIPGAKLILLPNLMDISLEHADSLFDRLFRAASGKYAGISALDNKVVVLQ
jgi:L-threonylcarbamoyladenylate synthase